MNQGSDGKKNRGVGASNAVVLPGSTAAHQKIVVDIRVDRLEFHGVVAEQKDGEALQVCWPWATDLVSFHDEKNDRAVVETAISEKITAIMRGLKKGGNAGLWNPAK